MLDCYFLDISPLLNGGILVNSLTVLPKDRTMNVLSYGSPGDRARSAGSGMLIEYVRNEYGVKGRLKVDRFGKPSFSGGPPFSIARSGSYTIIAVSDEPVGVDLARASSLDAGTFPFMFTGEELSIINGSGRWRRVAACRMWTGGYAPKPKKPKGFKTKVVWICEDEQSYEKHKTWMKETGRCCTIKL